MVAPPIQTIYHKSRELWYQSSFSEIVTSKFNERFLSGRELFTVVGVPSVFWKLTPQQMYGLWIFYSVPYVTFSLLCPMLCRRLLFDIIPLYFCFYCQWSDILVKVWLPVYVWAYFWVLYSVPLVYLSVVC